MGWACGMADAPVSGGEKGAVDGTLSIMVGGREDDVTRAMPLLRAMGTTIVHVGDSGAGQVAKACNQLVVASTIQAVAEALALAERAGVDPRRVREALLGGFAGSKILEIHGQRMLDRTFTPGFRSRLHLKDARIVVDTADRVGSAVPAFRVAADALRRLVDSGGGELDHSALFTLLERGGFRTWLRDGWRARWPWSPGAPPAWAGPAPSGSPARGQGSRWRLAAKRKVGR